MLRGKKPVCEYVMLHKSTVLSEVFSLFFQVSTVTSPSAFPLVCLG